VRMHAARVWQRDTKAAAALIHKSIVRAPRPAIIIVNGAKNMIHYRPRAIDCAPASVCIFADALSWRESSDGSHVLRMMDGPIFQNALLMTHTHSLMLGG
jgi:hypothetical protein